MNSNIILFFINWEKKYEIYIFDFNLNKLSSGTTIIIDSISDFNDGYGIFSKGYHLKDNFVIFNYFIFFKLIIFNVKNKK